MHNEVLFKTCTVATYEIQLWTNCMAHFHPVVLLCYLKNLRCGIVYNVGLCKVWHRVQYGIVYSVASCTVWHHVQCGICTVFTESCYVCDHRRVHENFCELLASYCVLVHIHLYVSVCSGQVMESPCPGKFSDDYENTTVGVIMAYLHTCYEVASNYLVV